MRVVSGVREMGIEWLTGSSTLCLLNFVGRIMG